jgi:MscS family membrane protein
MINTTPHFHFPRILQTIIETDSSLPQDRMLIIHLWDYLNQLMISGEPVTINPIYLILGVLALVITTIVFVIPRILRFLVFRFFPSELQEAYQQIVAPYQRWITLSFFLSIGDIVLLL